MILVAFIVFLAVVVAAVMAPSSKHVAPNAIPASSFPLLESTAD